MSKIKLPQQYVIQKFYEYGFKVKHQVGSNIYNCCCPICNEGKSWGKKQRCYYLPNKNLIYCHNCGWSSRPLKWIMEVSGMSIEDIRKELIEDDYVTVDLDKLDDINELIAESVKINKGLPDDVINLNNQLQLNYYKDNSVVQKALQYIKSRRLDTAINRCDLFLSLNDQIHKNRIIIPFKDFNNDIIFYQSRAFGGTLDGFGEDIKYLSMKGATKSVWGVENVQEIDYVFILEGPIDAMFVRNGIAVGGINTSKLSFTPIQQQQIDNLAWNSKFIWCLDSQWIDETSREKTTKLLEEGYCVFVWPKEIGLKYKDFNEYCVNKGVDEFPIDLIINNTMYGEYSAIKYNLLMKQL